MKILVICDLNFARSITTAYVLKKKAREKGLDMAIETAGFFDNKKKRNHLENICYYIKNYIPLFNTRKLTKEKVGGADIIYVMTPEMRAEIIKKYNYPESKIYTLNISKRYWFPYTPRLIKRIEEALLEHI
ncbi:MAG: hypothetical protein K6T16_01500 [Candidatus Pacearchaeota archaeon]|nr:hypothetical protein [Candidatus Pacearchaeota archaeon]